MKTYLIRYVFLLLCCGIQFSILAQSQLSLLSSFVGKETKVYDCWYDRVYDKKNKIRDNPRILKVEQDGSTILIDNQKFILEESIDPNSKKLFEKEYSKGSTCITYLDGFFYQYETERVGGKSKSSEAEYNAIRRTLKEITLIYSTDNKALKKYLKASLQDDKPKLQAYLDKMYQLEDDAKAKIQAEKDRIEAEKKKQFEMEYAKNSIKDKDIVKLEIVWLTNPAETSLGTTIKFGVKAFDKNGTEYKTAELGGKMHREELEFSTDCGCQVDFFGLAVPLPVNTIKNDQITLTVKSKYHPNIPTFSSSIKMAYSQPISIDFNGPREMSTSNRNGNHGESLKIYVGESTDKKYHLIEVFGATGISKGRLKMLKGAQLNIYSNGSSGKKADGRWRAGNGGNGGNIDIYHSPSVKTDFINIFNEGGIGGAAGLNGQRGRITKTPQAVNLSF